MSDREKKVWGWVLGLLGAGTLLHIILPLGWLIVSMFLVIGIFIIYCPPIFVYVLGAFCVNVLLSRRLPKLWPRLLVSVAVVLGVALIAGICLNAGVKADYNRLIATDVPLDVKPVYHRLVLIDDRPNSMRTQADTCGAQCAAYLRGNRLQAVLFAADHHDVGPLAQRQYNIYTRLADCGPPANDCLAPKLAGSLAVGDLIIQRRSLKGDLPEANPDDERVDAYLVTAEGLKLIMRHTSFGIPAYNSLPFPTRDFAFSSSDRKNGLQWKNDAFVHRRYYDEILQTDFGLDRGFQRVGSLVTWNQ